MRRLFAMLLLAALAVLALPGSALAQSDGTTCSYTAGQQVTTGDLDPGAGELAVYVDANGGSGSSGTASAAAGACLNTNTAANDVEGGTGEAGAGTSTGGLPGAYAVIDGDNNNVDPGSTSPANSQSDGYIGVSNYEDGANQDPVSKALECAASGPDNAANSGTNSGGCIGPDGGPVWVPIPVVPSPICGNTSGNTWHETNRDGCSLP